MYSCVGLKASNRSKSPLVFSTAPEYPQNSGDIENDTALLSCHARRDLLETLSAALNKNNGSPFSHPLFRPERARSSLGAARSSREATAAPPRLAAISRCIFINRGSK